MIERPEYLEKLIGLKDKDIVKVVTGIRRSGKTILLFNIFYEYLLSVGVNSNHIIKIAFDSIENDELREPKNLYNHIKDKIIDSERYYLLFDEIQFVTRFEEVINGLKESFNTDIYITGSNSKMLSNDINTMFRGRTSEIKVFPLSFKEFYSYTKGEVTQAFQTYIKLGGFPYLVQLDTESQKRDYLKTIETTITRKDIIDRYKIRNVDVFNAVYDLLCSSIGSYISSNKIVNTLKSNGFKSVDDQTVSRYLLFLCDSFLFYKVQRYDIKGKEYLKTLHKYYISDIGIRNSALNYRQFEITHILENIVYLELLRQGFSVNIGKNENKEVDFIVNDGEETFYIQVAYLMETEQKVEQEISSFYKINDGYKKIVISYDFLSFTQLKDGYKKINLFDFLLGKITLKSA